MINKRIGALASLLAVALLVLAACSSASPTQTQTTTTQPPTGTTATTAPPTGEQAPQYGGTVTFHMDRDVTSWDPTGGFARTQWYFMGMWNEHLIKSDWAKGPAGSGMTTWASGATTLELMGGVIAESWSLPNATTWIFKIRQGVHWALNPNSAASKLMNGRELTADDVIWTFKRATTSKNAAVFSYQPDLCRTSTMEKTGPWEVTLKMPVDPMVGYTWIAEGGGAFAIYPREVVEKYGDLNDWHNAEGTGPFMVNDYVSGSSLTLTRNSNYWQTDPAGPGKGNQLPYIDRAKFLIIPDTSTKLAAMRTGSLDWIYQVQWEDAANLIKTAPSLKSQSYVSASPRMVGMRTDKKDLPYADVKVRQALTIATDFNAILNDLYGGKGAMISWPCNADLSGAYTPIDKMDPTAQALYTYNPDKAKQLLADAGYPKGFDAKMVVQSVEADTDVAEVLKNMWGKVNVNLSIELRDTTTFLSIRAARSHPEMILSETPVLGYGLYLGGSTWRGNSQYNTSYVDDPPGSVPLIEDTYQEIQKYVLVNMPQADKLLKEKISPYLLDGAYMIQMPVPQIYTFWQPWIKNYHGEIEGASDIFGLFTPHVWLDQQLKATLAK